MEICKENTHKSNKTHKNCACCVQSNSCKKCRGVCIFSAIFFKKFPESRSIRKMANERFHQKEFELIRSFDVSESIEDSICYMVEDDESNEEDEVHRNEVYELLQKFHRLSSEQKKSIVKVHCSHYSYFEPWRHLPHLKTNKGNKIVTLYQHQNNYKDSWNSRFGSRQEKNRTSIHYGTDIYL